MRVLIRPIAILALLLVLPAVADAHGWGLFGRTSQYQTTTSYYYPTYYAPATVSYYVPTPVAVAPVAVAPVVVAPVEVCPQPVVAVPAPVPVVTPPLAQPVPAPPSRSVEPPLAVPPRVKESSQSFFQTYTARRADPGNSGLPMKQVGFWNTTQRSVTLRVNGDTFVLAPGRALTLNLPAQFAWQYDQGPARSESVPADRTSFEVVIRQ
jgi:hypothetical protein